MNIKPNKQPCPICVNHKGGRPLMLLDDYAEKHPYTHICNCPYCGRFLAENYESSDYPKDEVTNNE